MKNYTLNILWRIFLILINLFVLFYIYFNTELTLTLILLAIIFIYQTYDLSKYTQLTNKEISRFLLSVKHSDFSQNFSNKKLGKSFEDLDRAMDEVIKEFQKTRSEKEEHLRYLQTVTQHVAVGLISFDETGKVEFINNAAKRLLNITYLLNILKLDEQNPGLGQTILNVSPGEREIIKLVQNNEYFQLMINATQFKLRNVKYKLVSIQNIQSELEENELQAWHKITRVLTHEIMNSIAPISSLAGTVQNILPTEPEDCLGSERMEDISAAVATIQKRSEGLIHFVDNYRSITRVPQPEFQIFKISELFNRIEKLFCQDLEAKRIEFDTSVLPTALELTSDPELIEQVIINLIKNASQALENISDAKIKLIAGINLKSKITIQVADNGPGISEELREKIFIPFFTTKQQGSGIGLSLSRQIIRTLGGSISVLSPEDGGTIFRITFN